VEFSLRLHELGDDTRVVQVHGNEASNPLASQRVLPNPHIGAADLTIQAKVR